MSLARISHLIIFSLIMLGCLCTIVSAGILVGLYNNGEEPPTDAIETRARYLLFCASWTFTFSLAWIVGMRSSPDQILFSIVGHLAWLLITLVLFVSGAAALTSSVRDQHFAHQTRLDILAGFAWADSILVFIAILLVLSVGLGRRSGLRGNFC